MRELERYYRVLELESGATLDEVNQAYKDLAFVWHPDRIPPENQRLKDKAAKKLQEINEAREKLRLAKERLRPATMRTTSYSTKSTSHSNSKSAAPPQNPPPQNPPPQTPPTQKSAPQSTYQQKTSPQPIYQSAYQQTYQQQTSPAPKQHPDLSGKDYSRANLTNRDFRVEI